MKHEKKSMVTSFHLLLTLRACIFKHSKIANPHKHADTLFRKRNQNYRYKVLGSSPRSSGLHLQTAANKHQELIRCMWPCPRQLKQPAIMRKARPSMLLQALQPRMWSSRECLRRLICPWRHEDSWLWAWLPQPLWVTCRCDEKEKSSATQQHP